jgi:hypothetical protein
MVLEGFFIMVKQVAKSFLSLHSFTDVLATALVLISVLPLVNSLIDIEMQSLKNKRSTILLITAILGAIIGIEAVLFSLGLGK